MEQSDRMFLAAAVGTTSTYYGILALRYSSSASMDGGTILVSFLVGIIAAPLVNRVKLRYLVGLPVALAFLIVGLTASLSVFLIGVTTVACDWHTCLVRYGEIGRMVVIAGGPFMGYDPFLIGLLGGTILSIGGIFILGTIFTEQLKPIAHTLYRAIETFNQTVTKAW